MFTKKAVTTLAVFIFSGAVVAKADCISAYKQDIQSHNHLSNNEFIVTTSSLPHATISGVLELQKRTVLNLLQQAQIGYGPELLEFATDIFSYSPRKKDLIKISQIVNHLSAQNILCTDKIEDYDPPFGLDDTGTKLTTYKLATYADLKALVQMELRN